MYRRALVALDGSEVAETILPFIFEIAGPLEVTLLRVNVPVRRVIVEGAAQPVFEDPTEAGVARRASAARASAAVAHTGACQ